MLRLKIILQYNFIYILLLLAIIAITFIRINLNTESLYDALETDFTGTLLEQKLEEDKFSFILKGKEKIKCNLYLKNEKEVSTYQHIEEGITVTLSGNLSIPLNNTIPNTFNYKKYLKQNNIHYILNVNKFEVINNKPTLIFQIKNKIIKHINTYKSKDYLKAFIIGDKSLMDEKTKEKLQASGVSHIFAISGMHISLLSSIILLLLRKINIKENTSYIIVIFFLCFYMFITNFQASILRSVGLFTLLYINKRFDFNIEVLNILYLDIGIILIIKPNFLTNVGFLYSSVVSFSLIKYSKLIKGNYIIKTLKVSLIAFLFSLPITLINNYEFNLLSVINNLVIVPFVSILLYPLSLITFFVRPLDGLLLQITDLFELITPYLLNIKIIMPKVNIIVYIIYYILLYLFFASYKKVFLVLIASLLILPNIITRVDPNYYIYFLDVGQGDSIVIKKGGNSILIDTGGKVEFKSDKWRKKKKYYYTDNTVKFLHSIGISEIDYCILTHGDADHAGEIGNLLSNIQVKNIILNKGDKNHLESKIPLNLIRKSYKGSLDFKILDSDILYDNENDNSVINLLNAYNYKVLFMGDAGIKAEKDIIKKYQNLKVDLIKLGHHGSKTSSDEEFLHKIKAQEAIISSGRNNRYNHPNKETIDTLNKLKISYNNTQDKGTILYKISKNDVTVSYTMP